LFRSGAAVNKIKTYYIKSQQTKNDALTRQYGVQRVFRPLGHSVLDVQHLVSDQTAVSLAVAVIAYDVTVFADGVVFARGRRRPPQCFGHFGLFALHKAVHCSPTGI